jgi:hypothetical protein
MKKITYLFLLLLTSQIAMSQAVAPYSQDFNGIVAGGDNSSIVANWTQYSYGAATDDGDIWNGWSLNPGLADDDGAYTLYHDDDETAAGTGVDNWFVLYLDCTSQDEVTFSYDEFQTFNNSYYGFHGVYTSEDYDVANGDAGTQPNGTWTLLRQGYAPYASTNQSFTLPNTTTAIAFRYTGEWADNWFIDNITVGQCSADAPVSVSTPISPLDAATDVPILIDGAASLVNFTWPADADVASYTINLSESLTGFPSIGSLSVTETSIDLNYSWAPNTTYYWSIDSSNCAGSAEGAIFSFTTGNTEVLQTVFQRLQGNVYRQIESPADCGTCEEEINYYMFSAEGLRIIGTEYDGTCEQDDFTAFGTGEGEGEIVTDTTEEFEVCVGFLCQTITFTSAAEDEIHFDFPFFNQTWTAQLYEEEVPCLGNEPTTYDVTFSVDMSNETVSSNGVFVGGGFLGSATEHQLFDDDGDGIYSVTIQLADGAGGNYIFLNGPGDGGDWGAKEDLAGQECADAANWNDRILDPVTADTTILFCFGECTAECPSNPCGGVEGAPSISDDFDGNSVDILEWVGDNDVTYSIVDGASVGATSSVLEYVDPGSGFYANLQLRTCNKFDMSATNVFTMDVYIDGASVTGSSPNQIAFKLQNNDLGGNAWTTQIELVVPINAVDTWQTVEFDFTGTDAMTRDDIDQVVIQFNSEANNDAVTAYIDNLQNNQTLGLDDPAMSEFTYFPNPVNDQLTINSQRDVKDITVYNMLGQVVVRQTPNMRNCTVDMSTMQTGAYFVQVSIGNTVETIRVLKN